MNIRNGLYQDELNEFWMMYDSGKYYLKEIAEWFGITTTTANKYIKERMEKNYVHS